MTWLESLWSCLAWLGRASLEAGVLVAVTAAVLVIARERVPAKWRYALWALVLVKLALPWGPTSSVSVYNLLALGPAEQPVRQSMTANSLAASAPHSADLASPSVVSPTDAGVPAPLAPMRGDVVRSAPAPAVDWAVVRLWLVVVWLAGAMATAAIAIGHSLALWRVVRARRLVTDQATLDLLEDCKQQMNVRTFLAVVETDRVQSPALFGFIRPKLLLPTQSYERLLRDQLRHVFLHELAHLKRLDVPVNCLGTLLLVLHWFNPLLWYALARMRGERELACDAMVLERLGSEPPQVYGRTLIELLSEQARVRPLANLACVLENPQQVKRRIAMIADFRRGTWLGTFTAAALLVMLAAVGLTAAKTKEAEPKKMTTATAPAAVSQTVYITGVQRPGAYGLPADGQLRLVNLVVTAGGAWIPDRASIYLYRADENGLLKQIVSTTVDRLMQTPDSAVLQGGDLVIVSKAPIPAAASPGESNQDVYVTGQIPRPGTYGLPKGEKMSLVSLLVSAGLDPVRQGDCTILIVRRTSAKTEQKMEGIRPIDILSGKTQDVVLQAGDQIVVQAAQRDNSSAVETAKSAATQPNDKGLLTDAVPQEQIGGSEMPIDFPPYVGMWILGEHLNYLQQAQEKGLACNTQIHGVDENYQYYSGGLLDYVNRTSQPVDGLIPLGNFGRERPDFILMDEFGQPQQFEVRDNPQKHFPGRYSLWWQPKQPIAPGAIRVLGYIKKKSELLPESSDQGRLLAIDNHFGSPVLENFFLVLPDNMELVHASTKPTSVTKVVDVNIYLWQREVPAETTNRVNVLLRLRESQPAAEPAAEPGKASGQTDSFEPVVLAPEVTQWILGEQLKTLAAAKQKGVFSNAHVHLIDESLADRHGGLMSYVNNTGQPVQEPIRLGNFRPKPPAFLLFDELGRTQSYEVKEKPDGQEGFFGVWWTPPEPVPSQATRVLGYLVNAPAVLPQAEGEGRSLTMQNHFGDPVLENFFLVLPSSLAIASPTVEPTAQATLGSSAVYLWRREVPANTNNVVTVQIQPSAGQATNSPAPAGNRPIVIDSQPRPGQRDVDPKLTQIRVTFDRPMDITSFAWVGGGPSYPKTAGKPTWINNRTCVLPVQLEPDHDYWLSINSDEHQSFRALGGGSAVPYRIAFHTAAESADPAGTQPAGAKP
ncbi:MAG: hypothetical protein IT443_10980 [Phycisphaeraceae bacterium]|nr:hypothetical protein [Phycisphaeraceae bacterium]